MAGQCEFGVKKLMASDAINSLIKLCEEYSFVLIEFLFSEGDGINEFRG